MKLSGNGTSSNLLLFILIQNVAAKQNSTRLIKKDEYATFAIKLTAPSATRTDVELDISLQLHSIVVRFLALES